MQRKSINRYSVKKIEQLNAEATIRIELCRRAGGEPILHDEIVYRNHVRYVIKRVACRGGNCEICHQPKECLEPHERTFRSHCGVLSLTNSVMCCRACHDVAQSNLPMWDNPIVQLGDYLR
jgi:hypothetical protein